jgi:hypothetical protein
MGCLRIFASHRRLKRWLLWRGYFVVRWRDYYVWNFHRCDACVWRINLGHVGIGKHRGF